MNALDVLAEDHERLLRLLDDIERTPTTGWWGLRRHTNLVRTVVMLNSAHETIEERHFWPLVRKYLPDGNELAEHGTDQESSAKRLLEDLRTTKPGQADYGRLVDQLLADLRAHVDYEQTTVWPRIRESVDQGTLHAVGTKLAAARRTAPTRPHPDTPPQPLLLRTAGVCVGVLDRVRDALAGRGGETSGR